MLNTDDIPMAAAHWLTRYDSPALRRLAGLNGSEGWLIDQLWPEVLSDLAVLEVGDERTWDLSMTYLLAAWRAGDRSTSEVMSQVIRAYIENDYPLHVPEAGHLYGLDDELDGHWGRTPRKVLAEVEQTLTDWYQRRDLRS
jgi:hypothetical protein